MLLLLTIALVLIGAVALIIGFIQDSLVPIYISIGCSVLAAVVLVAFSRVTRREGVRVSALADEEPVEAPTPARAVETTSESIRVIGAEPTIAEAASAFELASDEFDEEAEAAGEEELEEAELVFPIADYDELKVSEILPLLSELDPDELGLVRDVEAEGKARSTILARIDALSGEEEAGFRAEAASTRRAPTARTSTGRSADSKSTAKKAAAKKAPAKKTVAKKAAVKKAAAKKTAAKKAAAAKTTGRSSGTRSASGRSTTARKTGRSR